MPFSARKWATSLGRATKKPEKVLQHREETFHVKNVRTDWVVDSPVDSMFDQPYGQTGNYGFKVTVLHGTADINVVDTKWDGFSDCVKEKTGNLVGK